MKSSMYLYSLAVVTSTFFAYLYQRLNNVKSTRSLHAVPRGIFMFAAFAVLFLVAGLRVNVGSDYESYVFWFHRIADGATAYFEPGFVLLNKLISIFTNDAQWLFIASSFITLMLIFTAIRKYSVNPALSVFLYSALSFFFYSFNATRQFIAVGIIFLAYGALIDRKWLKYMLYVLLACMFHKTALFMAFIYLVVNAKLTKIQYIGLAILASVSIIFRDSLLTLMTNIYPMYKDNEEYLYKISFSEILITTAVICLAVMLVYLKKNTMSLKNVNDRIYLNLVFLILLLHTGLAWVPAINRISLYLDISLILIIPVLLSKIKRKQWSYFFTILTMIFFSIYTYISIGLNNSNNVLPYNSVFSKVNESYTGNQ